MFKILQKSFQTGIVTARFPPGPDAVSDSCGGRPDCDLGAWRDAGPAAEICPTAAITTQDHNQTREVNIDYGKCVYCGLCAEVSLDGAVRLTRDFNLSTADRRNL